MAGGSAGSWGESGLGPSSPPLPSVRPSLPRGLRPPKCRPSGTPGATRSVPAPGPGPSAVRRPSSLLPSPPSLSGGEGGTASVEAPAKCGRGCRWTSSLRAARVYARRGPRSNTETAAPIGGEGRLGLKEGRMGARRGFGSPERGPASRSGTRPAPRAREPPSGEPRGVGLRGGQRGGAGGCGCGWGGCAGPGLGPDLRTAPPLRSARLPPQPRPASPRQLSTTTSDQTRRPAEFKHITKRRKRN